MSTNGANTSGPGTGPGNDGAVSPSPPAFHREISRDDARRMAPIYIGVIIVQVLTLLAIWWFQEYFS